MGQPQQYKPVLIPVEQSPLVLHIPSGEYAVNPSGVPCSKLDTQQPQQFLLIDESASIEGGDWVINGNIERKNHAIIQMKDDKEASAFRELHQLRYKPDSRIPKQVIFCKIIACFLSIPGLPTVSTEDIEEWLKRGCPELVSLETTTLKEEHHEIYGENRDPRGEPEDYAGENDIIPKLTNNTVKMVWEPKVIGIEGGLPKNNGDGTFSTTPLRLVTDEQPTPQNETVRQIAKREFDKLPEAIGNTMAWHFWKRAYDSAARNLPAPQQEMTEDEFISIVEKFTGFKVPESSESTWRYVWRNRNNPEMLKGNTQEVSVEKEKLHIYTETLDDFANKYADSHITCEGKGDINLVNAIKAGAAWKEQQQEKQAGMRHGEKRLIPQL